MPVASEIWLQLECLAALLLPLFVGRTFACRTPRLDTGDMTWAPAGRKKPDGLRECPSLTKTMLAFHILGRIGRGAQGFVPFRVGVYPLVEGNLCWFVAADIDDHAATGNIHQLVQTLWQIVVRSCDYGIKVYLEVSGGGHGVHLWLFFSEPVAAFKARRLLYRLICATGLEKMLLHGFDGGGSFDRLFPAQDEIADGKFGNLIALPYNSSKYWRQGRSIILDLGQDGTLPEDSTWPFVKPGVFSNTVTRHSAADVDAALSVLRAEGYSQEPPGGTSRGPARRPVNRKPRAKKILTNQEKDRSPSDVDWRAFLKKKKVPHEIRYDDCAYLEVCPFTGKGHSHPYTFWINLNTGFGNCWGTECDAYDGVPPSAWCKKLGLRPPSRKRKPRRVESDSGVKKRRAPLATRKPRRRSPLKR